MTRRELILKLREAAAVLRGGGEIWDDTWAEIFDKAATELDQFAADAQ